MNLRNFIKESIIDIFSEFEWDAPMKLKKNVKISENLKYHIKNELALGNCVFRHGSKAYFELFNEVSNLHKKGLIELNENDEFLVTELFGEELEINGESRRLNFIYEEVESISEAKYKGKTVQLNKPKRGGSKKFYVYVKNPKTGKIKKVSFGAKSGGQNLAVKLKDPEARKNFASRHNCEQKNDKTKAGYWACRLPRYSKSLGISGGGKWW